jgi:hypothetical protein
MYNLKFGLVVQVVFLSLHPNHISNEKIPKLHTRPMDGRRWNGIGTVQRHKRYQNR